MNYYDSNDFPRSSTSFVCFALTAMILFFTTSEILGQQRDTEQPSLSDMKFYNQPQINLAPFKEQIKILPFKGTASFNKYQTSDLISQISVFPNPTSDFINLELNEDAQLTIYSNLGKLIKSQELVNGENTLDVSFLNSGVYIIVISSADDSQSSRLIIER